MKRRAFLSLGTTGALALVHAVRWPQATAAQQAIPYGESRLDLSDTFRDGTLYIPKS